MTLARVLVATILAFLGLSSAAAYADPLVSRSITTTIEDGSWNEGGDADGACLTN